MAKKSKKSSSKKGKISRDDNLDGDENDGIDRISNLPEPMIHHILSFLQTIDVVRTSVLSKRWRYFWTSVPYLDFDYTLTRFSRMRFWFQFSFGYKFTDFVKRVLSSREECHINRFRLSCFNHCQGWVDRWVSDVVRHNVEELDISFCPDDSFVLPQCLNTVKSLTVFKLDLCYRELKMHVSMGFSRLTFLHFVSIKFLDVDLTRELFLSSPLLEHLILERCVFKNLEVLDIIAINLKTLTIQNIDLDSISDDGLSESVLKIFAPNLLSFKYMGPVARDYILNDLSSIADVLIQLVPGSMKKSMEELGCLMWKFIGGFYSAKVLRLSITFLESLFPVLGKPESFPAPFYNLKTLKLYVGFNKLHLQVIVHLLEYCPNLEALVVKNKEASKRKDSWQPEDGPFTCLMNHLKMVEIDNIKGQENELEFISFLLKYGKVLETMTIAWSMDLEKPLEIMEKSLMVMMFPKASSNVAITFH